MARLIILSCSRLKRNSPAKLPAIQRYDGPAFRLLRHYLRSTDEQLETYILSAKHGLIRHDRVISDYDQRMTLRRARELSARISQQTAQLLRHDQRSRQSKKQVFVNLGQTYLEAFGIAGRFASDVYDVKIASGPSGRRLSEMYDWLYEGRIGFWRTPQSKSSAGLVRLRGVEIKLSPEEVFDAARSALAKGKEVSDSYQAWYVQMDGRRVSPKWLVSLLTGLSVSEFHSEEARRVLFGLGVEVRRV